LIIPLIAGLIGGNAAGAALENLSLGAIGNTIAGAVSGVGLAQILGMVMGGGGAAVADAATTAASSGMDTGAIISGLIGGGVGGAVLTAIAGFVKSKMA